VSTAEVARDEVDAPEEGGEAALDESRLMGHSYDGIREYDNPLPGWWRWIFIGTIIFAGFYGLYFHVVGWGTTPDQRYREALVAYGETRETRERAELANLTEDYLARQVADPKVVARGQEIFKQRCVSCHGPEGAGLIGPNLTDDRQLHGTTRLDIYKTVRGGAPGTAMVAWGEQLPPADVVAAASFAITLRGKRLPGKAPEGLPVQPFSP